ncbi:MAG: DUF1579 domain-containing protein [Chitinophagaceae bacterium]|nr:MAG: DUF1579 domain-containing protein [Chitinophagaceae bacterium]
MKKWIPAALLLALAACNSENKPAGDGQPVVAAATSETAPADIKPKAKPDSATQAQNWQMYMTPGPEHRLLKEANGNWEAEVTMWMAPGAPAQTSTMSTENKMLLGDRYQQSASKGQMMGMPFEGISTVGFDNHKKKYISTWIDNMGTGMMMMEGAYDSTTKTINFAGKMIDPATGEECEERETYTVIDKDHHLLQMYAKDEAGKEFKVMQIHYRRKK